MNMTDTTLQISPEISAILHWFAGRDRGDVLSGLGVPEEVYSSNCVEIRVTAFYRETWRGGFLVSARPTWVDAGKYLHLAVVEDGCSGAPVVIEWTAKWDRVPPTTECPTRAKFTDFKYGDMRGVVEHLDRRIAEFFVKKVTASGKPRRGKKRLKPVGSS